MKQAKQFMQHMLLVLLGLVSTISVKAADYDFKAGNSDGVTIYYSVSGDEATVVAGDEKYSGEVNIPATVVNDNKEYSVTKIGSKAFLNCGNLQKVNIPSTVVTIGSEAFWECSSLSSIAIPNSVTTIGSHAFRYCSSLSSIDIPNSVTSIGSVAFSDCSSLSSITIPNGITQIESSTFSRCSSLSSIDIPNSVTTIGSSAFHGCSKLRNINIPQTVLFIGARAFASCSSLSSITIPNGITQIESSTFLSCSSLSSIDIPNSVTSIGSEAFSDCSSLVQVRMPNSLKTIDEGAFKYCTELEKVNFPDALEYIGNNSFMYTSLNTIVIPQKVSYIGPNAFNTSYNHPLPKEVTSYIEEPFEIAADGFYSSIKEKVTLYVPFGTKKLYENTAGWEFQNIMEMEPESNAYVVWCEGNTTLYFLTSDEALTEGGTYDGQTITKIWKGNTVTESLGELPAWNDIVKTTMTKTVFDESFKEVTPTSTAGWFDSCEKLEAIQGLINLNTSRVTNMYHMFYLCSNLTSLDLSRFDTSNVTNMQALFSGCSSISGLDVSNFNTERVTNMQNLFANCSYLIRLNVGNFNTENVTNMFGMFQGCSNLTSLDVSKFVTNNVTDMGYMFYNCKKLEALDLSNFNTSKVVNMERMFQYCHARTISLSNFDTHNVTSMRSMFKGCGIENVDLSSFVTINVTDMCWMFYGCSRLKEIDLSNFNTSNLTAMQSMFSDCTELQDITLSNWKTTNVNNFRGMFWNCIKLTKLDLSSFNTQNATDMSCMILGCYNLKEVDLSSFNTANVEAVDSMFRGCTVLEKIYVGDDWNMDKVVTHKEMFDRCYKIVGGNGTTYNSNYTNVTYARIDTEETPGYLTYKAAKSSQTITLTSDIQTFCSDKDLDFTGIDGLKAYIASGFNPTTGEVVMSRVSTVPAKTGLLLVGTAGQEYEVPFTETAFIYSNLLRGMLEDTEVTSGYVLNGDKFVAIDGTVTVKGGEAYLDVASVANAPRLLIRFMDTETLGIEGVIVDETAKTDAWYTLQGVRLEGKPSRQGVYLHQGRKVVVK